MSHKGFQKNLEPSVDFEIQGKTYSEQKSNSLIGTEFQRCGATNEGRNSDDQRNVIDDELDGLDERKVGVTRFSCLGLFRSCLAAYFQ
ncbi:hypothetical protein VNO80_12013 [Phaseolus coccineus]|uniref:Uncharacterized protein n=1 Tax=Phaseolus coccineus TaxID=3886 RepID=A0AAN9RBX8_PHACN